MSNLAGKVVIITGASRGIGAAAARVVAAQGASVVLAARDEQALERLVADIARLGGEATAVATDVADEVAVDRLVAATLDRYGSLHGAFNNAGSGHRPTPLAAIDPATFERTLDVNLRGVFLCLRAELPELAPGGAIVNMSSTAGLSGAPGMGAYSAAKHGVIGLTQTAALDYGPEGDPGERDCAGADSDRGRHRSSIRRNPAARCGASPAQAARHSGRGCAGRGLAPLGRGLVRQRRHDCDRRRQARWDGVSWRKVSGFAIRS